MLSTFIFLLRFDLFRPWGVRICSIISEVISNFHKGLGFSTQCIGFNGVEYTHTLEFIPAITYTNVLSINHLVYHFCWSKAFFWSCLYTSFKSWLNLFGASELELCYSILQYLLCRHQFGFTTDLKRNCYQTKFFTYELFIFVWK